MNLQVLKLLFCKCFILNELIFNKLKATSLFLDYVFAHS